MVHYIDLAGDKYGEREPHGTKSTNDRGASNKCEWFNPRKREKRKSWRIGSPNEPFVIQVSERYTWRENKGGKVRAGP